MKGKYFSGFLFYFEAQNQRSGGCKGPLEVSYQISYSKQDFQVSQGFV